MPPMNTTHTTHKKIGDTELISIVGSFTYKFFSITHESFSTVVKGYCVL
jgi:hypothetical protein